MRILLTVLASVAFILAPSIHAQTAATGTSGLFTSGSSQAKAVTAQVSPATSTVKVWVNTSTGVYHMPGSKRYGRTRRGKYLTEAEAIKEGYHRRGNDE